MWGSGGGGAGAGADADAAEAGAEDEVGGVLFGLGEGFVGGFSAAGGGHVGCVFVVPALEFGVADLEGVVYG